ncbi:hypothetical protein PILCRDRAFT_115603 [Piloderma croceum F 1598]|uniref:C2H2-type domain-containing protein n=1 Tax=Piloderma croceum (strain F 1598) TaxID=765440 RepID=A0A0C3CRD4_PILCF|nr:hypothetical protein PILCRDRAFT_115603 [Piloderma croceum F 1598]
MTMDSILSLTGSVETKENRDRTSKLLNLPGLFYADPNSCYINVEALSRFLTVWTDEWDHQDPDLIDGYLELCSEGEEVLDEIMRLTPMLTDEPRIPNAIRVQTTQVLIQSPNTYDLQTTNLADIYPSPVVVNLDIPEEELECDPPGANHYTNLVMEGLNCYDGHHAINKQTIKDKFKVSLPTAQSQMNKRLNQDKFDIKNTGVPLSASNDVVRNETVPADAQIVHKRKRSCRTDCEDATRGAQRTIEVHRNKSEEPMGYVCTKAGCKKTFSRDPDRIRHEKTSPEHGAKAKHKCPQCPKAYQRLETLNRHRRAKEH